MNKSTQIHVLWQAGRGRRAKIRALTTVLALAVLLAHVPASTQASMAAPEFAAIDRYIESEMQATRLPGLALGIVQGDKVVHLKGFGKADPSGRAATPQMPFTIGSTTKSFTALAVMQLVEAGKVELDAPVQRYLLWFRTADAEASARITVRHLLNQTSGFPTRETAAQLAGSDSSEGALERYVRDLSTVRLTAPVGTTFQYSNTNFNILGLIVQTVAGQPYEQYMQQHIFAPLQMHSSFWAPEEARAHGRATGYRYLFGWPVPYEMPYNRAQAPAGFLNSSAEEMTHYLIAQLNGGRYNGSPVLSPSGIDELHRPAAEVGYDDASYAMGWFVSPINGIPTVSHGGDTANFHADLVLVPEGKWGIVLLMNGNNGLRPARIAAIHAGVTSLLVGKEPPPFVAPNDARPAFLMYLLIALALQVGGLIWSMVLLRRWRLHPARRPQGWFRVALPVVPPLVLNLLWAGVCLVVMPPFLGAPLGALVVLVPDAGYTLLLSTAIALGWGLLRPVLVFWVLRTDRRPVTAGLPARA